MQRCPVKNIFSGIPEKLKNEQEELFETLLQTPGFRMERIVSQGQCSPEGFWYDQNENEWVMLLAGKAGLRLAGEEVVVLQPGDHINIPRHCRHRVEWTDPDQETVWLVVYYK